MNPTFIVILSTVGAALLFFLVRYAIKERKRIKQTGIRVEGLVVKVEKDYGSNHSATHLLHIQYTTAEGEVVNGIYRDIFHPSSYMEGDTLTIIYDVNNTSRFILANMRKK